MKKEKTFKSWWDKGIRFECQGSGQCCVSRDGYGYVYMTKEDRIRMAKELGIPTGQFTKKYCKSEDGIYSLIDGEEGRCQFLVDSKCSIYQGRPTQCRTWPFWPEVMNAKVWKKEVASYCPGVDKGRIWSKKDIQEQLELQKDSENHY